MKKLIAGLLALSCFLGLAQAQTFTVNNLVGQGTTNSTSTTTGAAVFAGGVGIAQNLFVGGTLTASSVTVSGSIFTGLSGVQYSNPIFYINDTSGSNSANFYLENNGTKEWGLVNTSSTNGFTLNRYVSGTFTDFPIAVSNSTGGVTIADGLGITTGGLTVTAGGLGITAGGLAVTGATTFNTASTFKAAPTVSYTSPSMIVNDSSGSGTANYYLDNNGTAEWGVSNNSTNNGFSLLRYVSGTYTDSPITVSNSSGAVTLADGVAIGAGSGVSYSNPLFYVNDTSGSNSATFFLENNLTKEWAIDNASSSNTFQIGRYSGGTLVDQPLTIAQSTGVISTPDGVSAGSGGLSSSGGLTVSSGGASITGGLTMATGAITPVQTTGIVGTTTNNNASSGYWGEYDSSTGSGVSMTNNSGATCASVSLAAGDYDVSGTISFAGGSGVTVTALEEGISTTAATLGASGTYNADLQSWSGGATTNYKSTPVVRESLASTTTVYLVGLASFSGGTETCGGLIHARRVR
jgi:hypothetical protein